MQNKIQELIIKYPKHFSRMIQNDVEMKEWVTLHSIILPTEPFPAHVYSAINKVSNHCINGKLKKFKGINDGFSFCGKAGTCKCCAEAISAKVSTSKQSYTTEKKKEINNKREITSFKKYGVKNNAQTMSAIQAHKALYADKSKVEIITNQIKSTKLAIYGDEKFNNRVKAEKTCLVKYGVKNTWSLTDDKQNPMLVYLKDKNKLSELFPSKTVQEIAEFCGVHEQTVYYYLSLHACREPYKSTFEQEIVSFLNSLGITNVIRNNRKLIGKELDIYLPDVKLAIEYNGVFWHHDQIPHITKTYHYDKFIACEKLGITLFTIFGNSWEDKKEAWKEKIKNKVLRSKTIFARKTNIIALKAKDTKEFLNAHHIQGYVPAQHRYGLTYNDKVVAIMTFSKHRVGIGKHRGENTFELVRYVTCCPVVGGASKLLKHFIKTQSPTVIISYSDNKYSIGDMYKKLGFELENETKNSYWYFDPVKKKAYHRYAFTKHKLVAMGYDAAKTGKQIMREAGYLTIYDCGTRTWILNC